MGNPRSSRRFRIGPQKRARVLVQSVATAVVAHAGALAGNGWIGYLVIGAVAGWLAGRVMQTGDLVVVDVAVGMVGALLGGAFLSAVLDISGDWRFTVITATCSAAVSVWLLRRRRSHP
jgi:uncharacterized membrane protein YeaQ/YmgE (transglycosylase-associated protein family)